ncbi:MAG TPA: hypothetical protein DF383_10360 [Deltaproteobacteria bacterium]|nr:hypothetical protein [Deltaproteobacteria bacterium]
MRFTGVLLGLLVFAFPLFAQDPKSVLQVGTPDAALEMEAQVQSGLPDLLQGIQGTVDELKQNDFEASQSTLDQTRKNLGTFMQGLRQIPENEELENSFQRIDAALDQAAAALTAKLKSEAMANLTRAYRMAKALSQSPVLKLTGTKVSLYLADQQIQSRNYGAAGDYLERAIDGLIAIQDDPNIDPTEIRALKNSVILAHQQVILGQQANGTYMSRIYQRATAATSNALYQYYNMWTRTPTPWDQNE